jgi:hypothetical protein
MGVASIVCKFPFALTYTNTPSIPFYNEQFEKTTQTKESYFFY